MKLTKVMEDHMNEEIQKMAEQEELSDDMLEAVAGGQQVKPEERASVRKFEKSNPSYAGTAEFRRQVEAYYRFVCRIQGSTVVLFDPTIDWVAKEKKTRPY